MSFNFNMASDLRFIAVSQCTQYLIDGIAANSPAEVGASLLKWSLIEPGDFSKLTLSKTPEEHATVIVQAVSSKVKSKPKEDYDQLMNFLGEHWKLKYLCEVVEEKLNELKSKEGAQGKQNTVLKKRKIMELDIQTEETVESPPKKILCLSSSPKEILSFSAKELAEWMKQTYSLSDDDCDKISRKSITGRVLCDLTEEHMKSLEFNFGTRIALLGVQKEIKPMVEPVKVVKENASVGTAASTRTVLTDDHYKTIIEQLVPVKAQWKDIAEQLEFKTHEIADILSNPAHLQFNRYINVVITRWLQWAPGDGRGSKDVATLEALQAALNNTNNARIKLTL